ncbi:hypothetical protein BDR05DRAFT_949592 [Suillus weaverae]|nr:hypothetical protein BDR05DRAFT_949592 [Suillus weaverae]
MIINDTEDHEANLVMELARARREKLHAEKSLADCVVHELELMASLSKFKSSLSEQKINRQMKDWDTCGSFSKHLVFLTTRIISTCVCANVSVVVSVCTVQMTSPKPIVEICTVTNRAEGIVPVAGNTDVPAAAWKVVRDNVIL